MALGLLVALELVSALKEKAFAQQTITHIQGNRGASFRTGTNSAFPFSFEAFRACSCSAEQLADVVALCPNTSPLQAATSPTVGVCR